MKTIIHVNQHNIKANTKDGMNRPVLTCKTYKENNYGHTAIIYDKNGEECCRIVYSGNKPLSCGARVWIETHNKVDVIRDEEA